MSISLWDLFPRDLFVQMREEGYVRVQTLDDSTLAIANYSEKTQYEWVWNEVTLQCRGLIFDTSTDEVVARPFRKFFNWDDSSQPYPPRGECVIMPKVDGSLGVLYWYAGEPCIATRGSFTREQAVHATALLREILADQHESPFHPDKTYLFEIIYPDNRIVVDYRGRDELVLLDVIDIETGKSDVEYFFECKWPYKVDRKVTVFDDNLLHQIPQGEEGFVLYWPYQDFRVKMKSADYIALHKLIFDLNARVVWERLGNGDSWEAICDGLPDEFHAWVRDIADGLNREATKIEQDVRKEFNRATKGLKLDSTRKEFAAKVVGSPNKSLLFLLYDGRSIRDVIWQSLRPSGADTIKAISEDVA